MSSGLLWILFIITLVICIALVVLVIILHIRQSRLNDRLDRFLTGKDGEDIEETINDKFNRLKVLEEKDAVEDAAIRDLYSRLKGAYQKTGVVKYDAFAENGGSLSFALCLLDDENSGIIMNVMNSHEGSYCYLKEIEKGTSSISLGREEKEALDIAMYAGTKQ